MSSRKSEESFLDCIIGKLKSRKILDEAEIKRLVSMGKESLAKEETLLHIDGPITVFGDIHGQFRDLLTVLDETGYPPDKRYLFLGDYVDRGSHSIEVISLVMAMKTRYPKHVYILRGNHESRCINRTYGFYEECVERYTIHIWHIFNEAFTVLPLCAVIGGKIMCMHGGIPRCLRKIDDIRRFVRPLEIPDEGILCDLLWSDPDKETTGWKYNSDRGAGHLFGEDAVEEFCRKFDIDYIVRAHQVCEQGFEVFANGRMMTIFSAPNYNGQYKNSAAALEIDQELVVKVRVFVPQQQQSPLSDDMESEEEGSSPPNWMHRALDHLQRSLKSEDYALYHPGQKDPLKHWWRTTMTTNESHLSFRHPTHAPIELQVKVETIYIALQLKAVVAIDEKPAPIVYEMKERNEYKTNVPGELEKIIREEVNEHFFKKVIEEAKKIS